MKIGTGYCYRTPLLPFNFNSIFLSFSSRTQWSNRFRERKRAREQFQLWSTLCVYRRCESQCSTETTYRSTRPRFWITHKYTEKDTRGSFRFCFTLPSIFFFRICLFFFYFLKWSLFVSAHLPLESFFVIFLESNSHSQLDGSGSAGIMLKTSTNLLITEFESCLKCCLFHINTYHFQENYQHSLEPIFFSIESTKFFLFFVLLVFLFMLNSHDGLRLTSAFASKQQMAKNCFSTYFIDSNSSTESPKH